MRIVTYRPALGEGPVGEKISVTTSRSIRREPAAVIGAGVKTDRGRGAINGDGNTAHEKFLMRG